MWSARLLVIGVGLVGLAVAPAHAVAPAPPPVQAQSPSLPPDVTRLQEWVQAVRLHEFGNVDAAAVTLARWSAANLKATLATLTALRGAMLHTDTGISLLRTSGLRPAARSPTG